MPSKWVKLVPWYYVERNAPSRHSNLRAAREEEDLAEGIDSCTEYSQP